MNNWTDKTAEQILADVNEMLSRTWQQLYGGIHITSIVPPEQGWPALYYCAKCARSVILLNPWAVKPSDGDYWRVALCVDVPAHNLVK